MEQFNTASLRPNEQALDNAWHQRAISGARSELVLVVDRTKMPPTRRAQMFDVVLHARGNSIDVRNLVTAEPHRIVMAVLMLVAIRHARCKCDGGQDKREFEFHFSFPHLSHAACIVRIVAFQVRSATMLGVAFTKCLDFRDRAGKAASSHASYAAHTAAVCHGWFVIGVTARIFHVAYAC